MTAQIERDGPAGEFGGRLSQESLLEATLRLEQVIAAAPPADPWYAELRSAIQACTLALEYHLDALDGAEGMRDWIGREEPRLMPRLERLGAALNHLLLEFWEAKEVAAHPRVTLVQPLSELASELRQVADGSFDLVHESLIPIGAED